MTLHRLIAPKPSQFFQLLSDWDCETMPERAIEEEKIDGWRCGWFRGLDDRAGLWTRAGMPIMGTSHIMQALRDLERRAGEPWMFDGEFQVDGTLAATKRWCEGGWKSGGNKGTLFLFDAMPEREWRAGGSETPLIARKARLEALIGRAAPFVGISDNRSDTPLRGNIGPLAMVDYYKINTPADVRNLARRVWDHGGEGIVIKDALSPYIRGRQKTWTRWTSRIASASH